MSSLYSRAEEAFSPLMMALMLVETQAALDRSPTEPTFTPKYISDAQYDDGDLNTKAKLPKSPPDFGFPLHPVITNPSPGPTSLPDIATPLTPLDPQCRDQRPSLLTIPLEIRLQIYAYVLTSHPIHHAHIAPPPKESRSIPKASSGPQVEELHTINLFWAQGKSLPSDTLTTIHPSTSAPFTSSFPSSTRLRPHIQGKIPTGLLSSCRQVFEETRLLPFQESSFEFVNWFWSGVYAARNFTRGLRPWQSEAIRWVGVEVLGRDLWGNGTTKGGAVAEGAASCAVYGAGSYGRQNKEWRELCELWGGVWGLRLALKGSIVRTPGSEADPDGSVGWNGEWGSWARDQGSEKDQELPQESLLDIDQVWIKQGLCEMRSLRWVEIEIEDEAVTREEKVAFCRALEETLDASRDRADAWQGRFSVAFVEKVSIEDDGERERARQRAQIAWGEPGDDMYWGLDM